MQLFDLKNSATEITLSSEDHKYNDCPVLTNGSSIMPQLLYVDLFIVKDVILSFYRPTWRSFMCIINNKQVAPFLFSKE